MMVAVLEFISMRGLIRRNTERSGDPPRRPPLVRRPDTSTKREHVSHLVGRFEQLGSSTTLSPARSRRTSPSASVVDVANDTMRKQSRSSHDVSLPLVRRTDSPVGSKVATPLAKTTATKPTAIDSNTSTATTAAGTTLTFDPSTNTAVTTTNITPVAAAVIPESAAEGMLSEEENHRQFKEIQDECEALRQQSLADRKSREELATRLEFSDLVRQGYAAQHEHMDRKVERLQRQLTQKSHRETEIKTKILVVEKESQQRPQLQKDLPDEEIDDLRRQLGLIEDNRQMKDMQGARVELQLQCKELQSKLCDADERAEAALAKARNLEKQLQEMKQTMSTATKTEKQVTDQEISERLGRLNHELQNWTVNTFRKVKLGTSDEMQRRFGNLPPLIKSTIPRYLYSNFSNANKVFTLQSTVVHVMMSVWREGHFFALPQALQGLEAAAEIVQSPTVSFNEWRSQTFLFLQRAGGALKETIDAARKDREDGLISDISVALSTMTETKLNDFQLTSLTKIVEQAIALAQLFSTQRAVYNCMLPEFDDTGYLAFDEELMEDVFDAEDTDDRLVQCVTFPALLKAGDELGDNMSMKNVIVKAKVLCQADEDDEG